VVVILVWALLLPFSSYHKSYGQSTTGTQDPFAGDWVNYGTDKDIIDHSTLSFVSGNTYQINLGGNCNLFPCTWTGHLDGSIFGETQFFCVGSSSPFSGHQFGLRIDPLSSQIRITIRDDAYSVSCSPQILGAVNPQLASTLPSRQPLLQPTQAAIIPQPLHVYSVVLSRPGSSAQCVSSSNTLAAGLSTSQLSLVPSGVTRVNIFLNASANNLGNLAIILATKVYSVGQSSNSSDLQSATIEASVGKNDFFVSPGEQVVVPLDVKISNSPEGNYKIEIEVVARDAARCPVEVKPLDLNLTVKRIPDFAISTDTSFLNISRGGSSQSARISVIAINGAVAPLKVNYTSGWDMTSKPSPSNTTVSFFAPEIILDPGQSKNTTLSISAPAIDDPNLAGDHYSGNFTYTIIAAGSWNETATIKHSVVKRIDISVSISEQPFDFRVSADTSTVYLLPGKPALAKINVQHLSGRLFPVTLQLDGLDYGMTIKLDKTSGSGDYVSVMSVNPVNFDFGRREINIRAEGGGITHILPLTLSQSPFKVVVDPVNESVLSPGQPVSLRVSVLPNLEGYNSTVSLRVQQDLSHNVPLSFELGELQGIPPFSTTLSVNSAANITTSNQTQLAVYATDGKFTDSAIHVISIQVRPQVQIDLEPRLDSLTVDNNALPRNQLPLIISSGGEGDHRIVAQPEFYIDSNKRYVFDGWSDGVKSNERVLPSTQILSLTIVGIYKPQYYLNITSVGDGDSSGTHVKGAGWYDNATTAKIEVQKEYVNEPSARYQFLSWSGPSASFLGQSCSSSDNNPATAMAGDQETIKKQESSGIYSICMDRPHELVALWNLVKPTAFPIEIVVGGIVAAAVAGGLAYFKFLRPLMQKRMPGLDKIVQRQQAANSNQDQGDSNQKSQQRNFPTLAWYVYASNTIRAGGTTFVDVLVENVGETDVKKVKISIACPHGIEYNGGAVSVDLIMAHESRKISFALRHVRGYAGPFEVTLGLGYEFMTKFIRRDDERKITLHVRQLIVNLFRPLAETDSEAAAFKSIKAWLEQRNVDVNEINGSLFNVMQGSSTLDHSSEILVVSIEAICRSHELARYVDGYIQSGNGIIVYSTGGGCLLSQNEEDRRFAEGLVGFSSSNTSQIKEILHGFGLKVSNSEHPIMRDYYGGDIFRIADQKGIVLTCSLDESAMVLAEQIVILENTSNTQITTIPAIVANIKGPNETDVVYFNIPIGSNIFVVANVLERALLYTGKMLK
jgi:hypothetical protein